ncbi:MAG: hypothetical protein JNM00_00720 [Flavobacteriales bacterium]|nr:hypothetical protein [Flavobacteriales bacterium]
MMRYGIYMVIMVVLWTACKPAEDATRATGGKQKQAVLRLQLTSTSTWCGGAEPPPWLLEDLATPKALPSKKVYVRKGATNDLSAPIIAEGTSNETGTVWLSLQPGTYSLVFDNKKDSTLYRSILTTIGNGNKDYAPVDKECLSKWLHTPELLFTLTADTLDTTFNVFQYCPWQSMPCTSYLGPMPP